MPEYEIPRTDTLTHLTTQYSSAVLIDATHAIVAHQDSIFDGFIQTFSWDSDFDNIAIVNTLEHADVETITYNSLIKIDDTHYALAFSDATGDGWIKTFSIDGSYVITEVNSFEFDATDGIWSSMALIDATHAVVAYGGVDGDGFIKTFSWDSGTADNITLVDTFEHDTAGPVTHNSLVLIDNTHFALAYTGVDGDGFLKTFSMGAGGTSIAQINSLEHEIADALWNSLVLIDTDAGVTHFALAYAGAGADGWLKTFSTDSSYSTITEIDSFEFNVANGIHNSLVLIDTDASGSHLLNAYTIGASGYVQTYSMDENYGALAAISRWGHDLGAGVGYSSLIQVSISRYFLAYTAASNVGTVKTIPVVATEPTVCPDAPAGGSLAGSGGWIF